MNSKSKKQKKTSRLKSTPANDDVPLNDEQHSIESSTRGDYVAFKMAIVSLGLLWLAFPPIGISWVAWIALSPIVWLILAQPMAGNLDGQRFRGRKYRQLYVAGLLYWLGTFYFIPIPHPALWLGWIAVSAYMAVYTPLFVIGSRVLVHRFKLPAVIAIPIVWTGIEWIRTHFATGMGLVCLSHTQYRHPVLIQIADLSGAYSLSFVIMMFTTGIALLSWPWIRFWFDGRGRGLKTSTKDQSTRDISNTSRWFSFAASLVAVFLTVVYGNHRLNQTYPSATNNQLKIALIQSSQDVVFRPMSDEEFEQQLQSKYQLTHQARTQTSDLDLIVWPESAFVPYSDLISNVDQEITVDRVADVRTQVWAEAIGYPNRFQTTVPLLTGGGTRDPKNDKSYASAFLISDNGQVTNRYFKNHLVMFGEYVPFLDWIPALKKFSPIANTDPGTKFESIEINGITLAPNICFESTVPHYIRRQINSLAVSGAEPDAMVNMTNDGWFFGTSCLDLHLACNVFRAVEMRKPNLVCANTGFSAEIDDAGRLLQIGPRRKPGVIVATLNHAPRPSPYRKFGDWIPMLMGLLTILAWSIGWLKRKPETV